MDLKISGLKIDAGHEELSGKGLSSKANAMLQKASEEKDPEKKKQLEQKAKAL